MFSSREFLLHFVFSVPISQDHHKSENSQGQKKFFMGREKSDNLFWVRKNWHFGEKSGKIEKKKAIEGWKKHLGSLSSQRYSSLNEKGKLILLKTYPSQWTSRKDNCKPKLEAATWSNILYFFGQENVFSLSEKSQEILNSHLCGNHVSFVNYCCSWHLLFTGVWTNLFSKLSSKNIWGKIKSR